MLVWKVSLTLKTIHRATFPQPGRDSSTLTSLHAGRHIGAMSSKDMNATAVNGPTESPERGGGGRASGPPDDSADPLGEVLQGIARLSVSKPSADSPEGDELIRACRNLSEQLDACPDEELPALCKRAAEGGAVEAVVAGLRQSLSLPGCRRHCLRAASLLITTRAAPGERARAVKIADRAACAQALLVAIKAEGPGTPEMHVEVAQWLSALKVVGGHLAPSSLVRVVAVSTLRAHPASSFVAVTALGLLSIHVTALREEPDEALRWRNVARLALDGGAFDAAVVALAAFPALGKVPRLASQCLHDLLDRSPEVENIKPPPASAAAAAAALATSLRDLEASERDAPAVTDHERAAHALAWSAQGAAFQALQALMLSVPRPLKPSELAAAAAVVEIPGGVDGIASVTLKAANIVLATPRGAEPPHHIDFTAKIGALVLAVLTKAAPPLPPASQKAERAAASAARIQLATKLERAGAPEAALACARAHASIVTLTGGLDALNALRALGVRLPRRFDASSAVTLALDAIEAFPDTSRVVMVAWSVLEGFGGPREASPVLVKLERSTRAGNPSAAATSRRLWAACIAALRRHRRGDAEQLRIVASVCHVIAVATLRDKAARQGLGENGAGEAICVHLVGVRAPSSALSDEEREQRALAVVLLDALSNIVRDSAGAGGNARRIARSQPSLRAVRAFAMALPPNDIDYASYAWALRAIIAESDKAWPELNARLIAMSYVWEEIVEEHNEKKRAEAAHPPAGADTLRPAEATAGEHSARSGRAEDALQPGQQQQESCAGAAGGRAAPKPPRQCLNCGAQDGDQVPLTRPEHEEGEEGAAEGMACDEGTEDSGVPPDEPTGAPKQQQSSCPAQPALVKLFICSGCRRARFCSAQCSWAAWPNHKKECSRAPPPATATTQGQ